MRPRQQYETAMATQLARGTVDAGAALLLVQSTLRWTQGRLGELVPALERAYARGHRRARAPARVRARGDPETSSARGRSRRGRRPCYGTTSTSC